MTAATRVLYTAPAALVTGHEGDAGVDLPASQSMKIYPGEWANIPCEVRIALPEGMFAFVMGRSSTFFKKHLMVNTAVIDEGYRGDLFTCCYNIGTRPYVVEVGERLAQLVLMPRALTWTQLVKTDQLPGSARGERGFGSTG